jgi:hypothetical protein
MTEPPEPADTPTREAPEPPRRRRRRRAALPAGAALLIAAGVVAYLVVSNGSAASDNSGGANGSGGSTAISGAATVKRRNLIETDTESGTLSYATPQTVYNRLSGTITWLPSVGQVIKPGKPLFDVDNAPVWLMSGSTPAYRDLDSSDSAGPDIYELNAELVSLGMNPDGIVVDDEWQAATTAGVDVLQYAYGETETGSLTLGKVVFLPGPQLVNTLDGAVGATGGGASDASYDDSSGSAEFVSLTTGTSTTASGNTTTGTTPYTTTTATTPTSTATTGTGTTATGAKPGNSKSKGSKLTSEQQFQALLAVMKAEIAQLKNSESGSGSPSESGSGSPNSSSGSSKSSGGGDSGTGGSSGTSSGSGSGGGTPVAILQTSSTQLIATVDLAASSQSEAVIGSHVSVEMPDGSYVGGKITKVSPVAQNSSSGGGGSGDSGSSGSGSGDSGSGSGSSATVPVTITLDKRVKGAGLDQAAVSVNFSQARANQVLSVPVTALVATSGSTFAVQEATAPYKLVRVTTGLFAAGYVQVSGPGVYVGLKVTDSQG